VRCGFAPVLAANWVVAALRQSSARPWRNRARLLFPWFARIGARVAHGIPITRASSRWSGSLFVVSGGIHINVKGDATPLGNVVFLFIGAVVAMSWARPARPCC